ncbi:TIGR03089 family protein [Naumannella halotolerans]|uniref:TIGR03089 family protein n=1 Tax=Naumannella halotolerans TaxID=993414 RepID=UPI00370DD8D5
MPTPVDLLAERVRHDGARPLLTQYRDGARTELSAASFANWADKTVNWLDEEDLTDLDGTGESLLAIELALTEPAHWMTFVWWMAAWQAGLPVTPVPAAEAAVRVGGPTITAGGAEFVIGCSLHPFAMPGPVAPGVLDFSDEVRPQPDVHQAAPVDPERPAWLDRRGEVTVAGLLDDLTPTTGVGLLTTPTDAWTALRQGLLSPLLGGGSAVLVSGTVSDAELATITRSEGIRSD